MTASTFFIRSLSSGLIQWQVGSTCERLKSSASILTIDALKLFWARACDDIHNGQCGVFPLAVWTDRPSFFLIGRRFNDDVVLFNQIIGDCRLLFSQQHRRGIDVETIGPDGGSVSAFATTIASINIFLKTLSDHLTTYTFPADHEAETES